MPEDPPTHSQDREPEARSEQEIAGIGYVLHANTVFSFPIHYALAKIQDWNQR